MPFSTPLTLGQIGEAESAFGYIVIGKTHLRSLSLVQDLFVCCMCLDIYRLAVMLIKPLARPNSESCPSTLASDTLTLTLSPQPVSYPCGPHP